jgi:hypothetical protein
VPAPTTIVFVAVSMTSSQATPLMIDGRLLHGRT